MTNSNLIRISFVINLLLIAAVSYLFLRNSGKKSDLNDVVVAEVPVASAFADTSSVRPPIVAYVNSQRISEEYLMLVDQNVVFTQKMRSSDNKLMKERDKRQKEVEEIQSYVQKNPNMSDEDLSVLEASIYELNMELDSLQAIEKRNLQISGEKMQGEVATKIDVFLKKYVASKGIDYVFGYDPSFRIILYGNPAYDITNEVLAELNKEYLAEKEEEKK